MTPLNLDVLVCGGGMAGSVAAIAAARTGADTLLIERWSFLAARRRPPPRSASSSAGKPKPAAG